MIWTWPGKKRDNHEKPVGENESEREDVTAADETASKRPATADTASARPDSPAEQAPREDSVAPDDAALEVGEEWKIDQDEVRPLSLVRIKEALTILGYRSALVEEKHAVEGMWNQLRVSFIYAPNNHWLRVRTRWNPPPDLKLKIDRQTEMMLMEAANEWNRQYLQPTAFAVRSKTGLAIDFDYLYFVRPGITTRQLLAALDRSLHTSLQAQTTVGKLLPPLF